MARASTWRVLGSPALLRAHVQVRMDEESSDTMANFLRSDVVPSTLNRMLMWSVYYDMARDAELSARKFLALAREFVRACVVPACVGIPWRAC